MGQRRSILICRHHCLALLKFYRYALSVYRLGVILVGHVRHCDPHICVAHRVGAMVERVPAAGNDCTWHQYQVFRFIFATGACFAGVAGMMLGSCGTAGNGRTAFDTVFGGDYHWRHRVSAWGLCRGDYCWACGYWGASFCHQCCVWLLIRQRPMGLGRQWHQCWSTS